MICSVAYNAPLTDLRKDLGLPAQCHGRRADCIKGYDTSTKEFTLGIPGTAIGYCQALFKRSGSSYFHTKRVLELLNEIHAPWSHSHEMSWDYHDKEQPAQFVEQGVLPLRTNGRVPILITRLDPGRDYEVIDQVVHSSPAVAPGETILIRILLNDESSILGAVRLMRQLYEAAVINRSMPTWWPLIQGSLAVEQWESLEGLLGDLWSYVNAAVNPFTPKPVKDFLASQVTVAQIPVGLASGVRADGTVALDPTMQISGASGCAVYSLLAFLEELSQLSVVPTLIVLGPASEHWTDTMNQDRVRAIVSLLRVGCKSLWKDLPPNRQELLWKLSA